RHTVPKKKCTAVSCWLFSANANSVKKMAALSSHIRYLIGPPVPPIVGWAPSGLVLHFGRALVHGLAQRLAGLEVRHALFGDVDALARARVAAPARRGPVDREAAEAADLDA